MLAMQTPSPRVPQADPDNAPLRAGPGARATAAAGAALGLTAVAALLALTLWLALPYPELIDITSESGPIEQATAVGYLVAALAPWWLRPAGVRPALMLGLSLTMLAFALRELSWHQLWTGHSVLGLRFYLNGEASVAQRVTVLAVLLPVAIALGVLACRGRATWQAARRGAPAAGTALVFVALLFATKGIDRSLNMLAEIFHLTWPLWLVGLQFSLEETLELALPLLALLGFWQGRRQLASAAQPGSTNTVSTPV